MKRCAILQKRTYVLTCPDLVEFDDSSVKLLLALSDYKRRLINAGGVGGGKSIALSFFFFPLYER